MSVVTRFPPSPTGFMHIGNARTALFNWLFSKNQGGKFLVRIEDTDRERYSEEAVQVILNGLEWLGLDYDNTPESQFANRQRHIDVAHELLAAGKAYKCYCTPEELDEMREKAKAKGLPTYYDRRWRDKDESEAPEGIDPVIRIKAPLDGSQVIDDQVQGKVEVQNKQLDDFIILRSDGTPTYMLAVVVDDHDMNITHVIRGDDHLNNTFRQNVIYGAMGWKEPTYGHLPLIHGPDGSKFSKRHGAQSVEEYRDMGYLPEAMRNYLLRLGWSHGDDEIIPTDKAIEWFNLDSIQKSPANFDFAKLENLNAHYISEMDAKDLIEAANPFFDTPPSDLAIERMSQGLDELKKRSKTLVQFAQEAAFYDQAPSTYNEGAQKNLDSDGLEVLSKAVETFTQLNDFTPDGVMSACKKLAAEIRDGKLGKIGMPLRAALTGSDKSPAIFEAAAILGKDETLKRIQAALSHFPG
ncbi:MAG: glutamate--tRNA ligase [Pseudomonadota bacterium]